MEVPTINNILPTSSLLNSQDPSSSSSSFSTSSTNQHEQHKEHEASVSYRVSIAVNNNFVSSGTRDDLCSCFVILLTFWFFVSVTLIHGFYGSEELLIGPNCSRRLQANSFFVQDLKVKAASQSEDERVMLYGFLTTPALDVRTTWSESHSVLLPANSHKEWMYYLNVQAQIDISYNLKSNASQPLIFVIAQGTESLIQWIENPSYPNATLSWSLIHGNGMIQHSIADPSVYYVAVENPNHHEMEVQVYFRIQNLLYNTTGAYYKCSLGHSICVLKLFFLRATVAILTTSGPQQDERNGESRIKLSYGPRRVTYFIGSGLVTLIILLAIKMPTNFESYYSSRQQQTAEVATGRTPLLPNKDDDDSSMGSSYDSVSHDSDEKSSERWINVSSKSVKKEGESDNPPQLCTICCDAQRDCFFLPCGHCTTCFTCGTSIANNAGTCPICRRKMKKVRQIFTV